MRIAAFLLFAGSIGMTTATMDAQTANPTPPHAIKVDGDAAGTHDPSIIRDGNTWYLFATATGHNHPGELPIRCSTDLHHWERCGYVFPGVPDWIKKESPQTRELWAPDISYFNGSFHLYYAFSVFGKNTSGIALLTNKTLDPKSTGYRWEDQGLVLESKVEDDFNAIDPNLVIDESGKAWLSFGSFWGGIKMRRIDPKTGKLSSDDTKLYSLASRKRPANPPPNPPGLPGDWQAIEAPFIVHHGGYYYLFVSFDLCCRGTKSTYTTMVGRSHEVTGPYEDASGTPMLEGGGTQLLVGNGRWLGPGGESIRQGKDKDEDIIVFHAYDAKTGAPSLQISSLTWTGGWPHAALDGDEPEQAQQPAYYEPTLESLDRHPLPEWYADAKLGIFIHWGLYSVPGWAPLVHPDHDFTSQDYITHNPYAEWYLNSMRLEGSPTQAYHREHYGKDYDYYNFAPVFDKEIRKWDPDAWAGVFRDTGAKYVVLTSKHHDGFTLWPSAIANPTLPADRQHASRDIVGELTTAVRQQGLRMGLYYSGGYDWTFVPGPIRVAADYQNVKPQTEAYGKYVDAQMRELISRYHPALLWNDIDYPKSGHPLEIMAEYYNAVPDGVIDDRFGVKHSDFKSPEYQTLDKISPTKWEECRGLGRSFGYNRAEGEAETIPADDLIYLLADIVSKNGNLLLDVGPEDDGTIPPVQMERLQALGTWLRTNGEAIYGTHPWTRAVGETSEGIHVRFTQKDSAVYAILLGEPKTGTITITSLTPGAGATMHLLGDSKPIAWSQLGEDVKVTLPTLAGRYAYVLKIKGL